MPPRCLPWRSTVMTTFFSGPRCQVSFGRRIDDRLLAWCGTNQSMSSAGNPCLLEDHFDDVGDHCDRMLEDLRGPPWRRWPRFAGRGGAAIDIELVRGGCPSERKAGGKHAPVGQRARRLRLLPARSRRRHRRRARRCPRSFQSEAAARRSPTPMTSTRLAMPPRIVEIGRANGVDEPAAHSLQVRRRSHASCRSRC